MIKSQENPIETVHEKLSKQKRTLFLTVFIFKYCKAYKNMQHIKIKPELFLKTTPDGQAKQARKLLPDEPDWQLYLAGTH